MINFIIGMYRNPKPGSMCWYPKVHRWGSCISGDPRYILSTILIVCVVAALAVLAAFVVSEIRG
jgi:hypothetical protein